MRRIVIAAAAWGLGVACTRANPAFGDAAETGGGTVDATTASTPTGTTEALTLDTVGEEATSEPSGSEVGSETGSGPDLGATTGDLQRCDDAPSAIRSLEVTGDRLGLGDCASLFITVGEVDFSSAGELHVVDCGECGTCDDGDPVVQFKATGIPMPLAAGGSCVEVVVERAPGCGLRSLAISDAVDEWLLLVSATDTLSIPPTIVYPEGLDVPEVETLCTRDGCGGTGDYALGFGTASYGPGTDEAEVPLFDGAFDFDLVVRNAGVDSNCELDIAWDALGIPP